MRAYLYRNKQTARDFIRAELPRLTVVPGEATYLLWLDCRDYTDDSVALAREIRARTGLLLSNGSQYGRGGETFLRMNIACPRARVLDGLERLRRALT